MIVKPTSALLMVFFGQINIFGQNQDFLASKVNILRKNSDKIVREIFDKKNLAIAFDKQRVSRIARINILKSRLSSVFRNFLNNQSFFSKKTVFYASFISLAFDFNSIKPNCFGC